jgi:probable addiction module antidote protein
MPKRTKPFHDWLLKRLVDPHEAERYLRVAMSDSTEAFLKALRNVAEARQISKVAAEAGVNRESLYKTLSDEGNPTLSTLSSVLGVLDLRLTVEACFAPTNVVPSPTTPAPGSLSQEPNSIIIDSTDLPGQIQTGSTREGIGPIIRNEQRTELALVA